MRPFLKTNNRGGRFERRMNWRGMPGTSLSFAPTCPQQRNNSENCVVEDSTTWGYPLCDVESVERSACLMSSTVHLPRLPDWLKIPWMFQDPRTPHTAARGLRPQSADADRLGSRNPTPLRVTRVEYRPLAEAELRTRLFRAFDLLGMRADVLQPLPDREQALICGKGKDDELELVAPQP